MTIGEVSNKYKITTDTLRYYERIGLIPPVPRKKNGIRDYDETACGWVSFIKCMRNAGVQIEALIELVGWFTTRFDHTKEYKHMVFEHFKDADDPFDLMESLLDSD